MKRILLMIVLCACMVAVSYSNVTTIRAQDEASVEAQYVVSDYL